MAFPAQHDQPVLLDHVGPWTEEEFLALPDDRRIELLDGGLLVSPGPGGRHQRMSFQLCYALGRAAPDWLEVLEAINVRVGPDRILIPDLVVVTNPGMDLKVWDPADVAMIVEIVSPGSVVADRAIKPQLYAAAGIEHYLRIELGRPGPSSVAYRSQRGHYVEVASSAPGQVMRLSEPFPVELDLAELAAATRPPG
ncbi:MAG: Uma2 family endonuclease [Pseudonocardiaceae bacterium]